MPTPGPHSRQIKLSPSLYISHTGADYTVPKIFMSGIFQAEFVNDHMSNGEEPGGHCPGGLYSFQARTQDTVKEYSDEGGG